jgi:hypothetical protein
MDDSSVFGRNGTPEGVPAWARIGEFPGVGPMADESHLPEPVRRELQVALRASLRWTVWDALLKGAA